MYGALAGWWPLLSAPEDYHEEASAFTESLVRRVPDRPRTLLELGSGGGNNASHMKAHFDQVTLVDVAEGMLDVSRALNPECEHLLGDMRAVRLGRTFDCVFVHDAVAYMTTRDDLRAAMTTAWAHLRPGGVALFVPDFVEENFQAGVDDGGHDGEGRALRYLSWCSDPEPGDQQYRVDYAYMLRERDGSVRVLHDQHVEGLFSTDLWLELLGSVGFEAETARFQHSEESYEQVLFLGRRPEHHGTAADHD